MEKKNEFMDFEFVKYFGVNNLKNYKWLKKIKDDGDLTWKEVKDIEWKDIDLDKKTISIPKTRNEAR